MPTALKRTRAFLDGHRPRAFRLADLKRLFREHKAEVRGFSKQAFDQFLEELLETGDLREAILRPQQAGYKDIPRYVWRGCTPLEIASTLKGRSYLSHGTAMFLHGLTEQLPRTYYVNREQSAKPSPAGPLRQANIDRAFRSRQRTSNYIFTYERNRYTLLAGKHTDDYGVIETTGPAGEPQRVTDPARTLVDIAVRPVYAGGVVEVLHAYRAARESVTIQGILDTLDAVDHMYPYHQAIGFYMQRADYPKRDLDRLRERGVEHDFYLTHKMPEPAFDESWRVFHPEGL